MWKRLEKTAKAVKTSIGAHERLQKQTENDAGFLLLIYIESNSLKLVIDRYWIYLYFLISYKASFREYKMSKIAHCIRNAYVGLHE